METAISCYALLAHCTWTIEPIIEDEDNVIPVIGETGGQEFLNEGKLEFNYGSNSVGDDNYIEGAYLIFVTGATGSTHVNFFWPV